MADQIDELRRLIELSVLEGTDECPICHESMSIGDNEPGICNTCAQNTLALMRTAGSALLDKLAAQAAEIERMRTENQTLLDVIQAMTPTDGEPYLCGACSAGRHADCSSWCFCDHGEPHAP